jgi:hypothetical protein
MVKMISRLTLFVPEGDKDTKDVKNNWGLLKEVESLYHINISKQFINNDDEKNLKSKILLPISITKRIGFAKTNKAKSLYPQLILFFDDEPFTFYPQSYSKDKITMEEFLRSLIQGEVKCLHDTNKLIENMRALKKEEKSV